MPSLAHWCFSSNSSHGVKVQPGLRTTDHPPLFFPGTEARMGTTVQGYRGLVAQDRETQGEASFMKGQPYVRLSYFHAETLPQTLVTPLLETLCGFVSHLVSAQPGGGLRGPEAQVWVERTPLSPPTASHPLLASSFLTPVAALLWARELACCLSQGPSRQRSPRLPGCFLGLCPESPIQLSSVLITT